MAIAEAGDRLTISRGSWQQYSELSAKDRGSATLHLSGWSCLIFAEFGLDCEIQQMMFQTQMCISRVA